ncbi:MAG TPA: ATP-binding protein, partial [Ktedonobacteraceae bacterium]|nr:ATP-binding protein [Ktedonobacteraceae bacterium]
MKATKQENWQQANKNYLMAHLERMLKLLKREEPSIQAVTFPPESEVPPALDTLCANFGLSTFERDILLLCAGAELNREIAALCAEAQENPRCAYPTFNLALSRLSQPHWTALAPDAPLRFWQLIRVESESSLVQSPLRIEERILHYLLGISCLDRPFQELLRPLIPPASLVASQARIAREIAALWMLAADDNRALPVVQLCGGEALSQREIAAAACALLNHRLFLISASALPVRSHELENLLHGWERETWLSNSALFLDCQLVEQTDSLRESQIARVIEATRGLLIVASREKRRCAQRLLTSFQVEKPLREEQQAIWEAALGRQAAPLNDQINRLTSYFHLNADAIQTICLTTRSRLAATAGEATPSPEKLGAALWETCRVQATPELDNLARRIPPAATWQKLVLADAQQTILRDIAMHVRHRTQVYEDWGFGGPGTRGLGISALFAGASGVGKTMAAEVLANELHLELYHIDLSAVISKYIGETEKNLRLIFDAAEGSGVILLFDEADALFGKRSEVKSSHDRYANIEVSYLLQRMEAYRGLTILTTNMKETLDTAFLRR